MLNHRVLDHIFYITQNTVLTFNASQNGEALSIFCTGSACEQGKFTIVVFFCDSETCFQHVFLSFRNQGSAQCIFMDERREVFVLNNNQRERGRMRKRGVCEGSSELPFLSCYSNSSLCFFPLTGPWPFLMEPFWGRRRCPRSCSVHRSPPCPSSLSRSESECMRAEEVGAGTGLIRPEYIDGKRRQAGGKKQNDVKMIVSTYSKAEHWLDSSCDNVFVWSITDWLVDVSSKSSVCVQFTDHRRVIIEFMWNCWTLVNSELKLVLFYKYLTSSRWL